MLLQQIPCSGRHPSIDGDDLGQQDGKRKGQVCLYTFQ